MPTHNGEGGNLIPSPKAKHAGWNHDKLASTLLAGGLQRSFPDTVLTPVCQEIFEKIYISFFEKSLFSRLRESQVWR